MIAATNDLTGNEELPVITTGEPTDQLEPEDNEPETNDNQDDVDLDDDEPKTNPDDFDDEPMDDDEDLDDDEVKRLFPGEDSYTKSDDDDDLDDDEPYEGIRHGNEEDEGLVDDNMTGMPVIPSPS